MINDAKSAHRLYVNCEQDDNNVHISSPTVNLRLVYMPPYPGYIPRVVGIFLIPATYEQSLPVNNGDNCPHTGAIPA